MKARILAAGKTKTESYGEICPNVFKLTTKNLLEHQIENPKPFQEIHVGLFFWQCLKEALEIGVKILGANKRHFWVPHVWVI